MFHNGGDFLEFLTAKGIVVGETAINEGDKMLTVYTDEYGLINAKAPGAKSLKRKDMAGINMFCYGDYILTRNKQIYTVRECNIITNFFDIKKDITAFAVGCYILEAVRLTGAFEQPDEEILRLALNSLYALSNNVKSPLLIKSAFEIRLCVILGVVPEMSECMFCQKGLSECEFVFYNFIENILSCDECMGVLGEHIKKISLEAYRCIKYISEAELSSFLKFNLGELFYNELFSFSERLFLTQIDFVPKTLTYLKTVVR